MLLISFLLTIALAVLATTSSAKDLLTQQFDFFARYERKLDWSQFQTGQPVIGIMTMPFWNEQLKPDSFNYKEFVWEHNVNFVHYAGSWAVPIRYDLSDDDLYALLDQINGVLMPGGGLLLIDDDGTQHPFYITSKKIFEYSKRQKDEHGVEWPIFGICQGFEALHYMVNDDRLDTLTNVRIYGESRKFDWKFSHPKAASEMFKDFPSSLLHKMSKEKLAFHAHDWTIAEDTYRFSEKLRDFFTILATDTHNGTTFLIATEAKHYPISGIMFHPETQALRFFGEDRGALKGRVNTGTTDAINFYFSNYIHEQAKKNLASHKFRDASFGLRMSFKNAPVGFTNMKGLVLSYGFGPIN